jgi:hypothetical protein
MTFSGAFLPEFCIKKQRRTPSWQGIIAHLAANQTLASFFLFFMGQGAPWELKGHKGGALLKMPRRNTNLLSVKIWS